MPGELLHVIPNGVDLLRFRPDPARRLALRTSAGIPATAPVVVFAARYDAMKNVPLFLRSAREWLAREPDGHGLMCGAGLSPANPRPEADVPVRFRGGRGAPWPGGAR